MQRRNKVAARVACGSILLVLYLCFAVWTGVSYAGSESLREVISAGFDGGEQDTKPVKAENVQYDEGKEGKGLLVLSDSETIISYSTNGWKDSPVLVFDFWFQPRWGGDDGKGHILFSDKDGYIRLLKTDYGTLVFWIMNQSDTILKVYYPIKTWRSGEWYHIRAGWDIKGQSYVEIDGKRNRKTKAHTGKTTLDKGPLYLPEELFIGHFPHKKYSARKADGTFDNFKVYVAEAVPGLWLEPAMP